MDKKIKELDLIIIGAGPAGLTSAIYASRAKLSTLVLEDNLVGGQVRSTYTVENYPGFTEITGNDLADRIQAQAEACGAIIDEFDFIENVSLKDDEKIIETGDYIYKPKAVIIATGATPKKLPIPSESKYLGKGVHYCAVCDGAVYQDEVVAVVGGGNAALEEALYLSNIVKKVIVIRRYDYFRAEAKTLEAASNKENIEIMYNWDLVDVLGGEFVEAARIKNTKTGEEKEIAINGVFGYIGTEPKTYMFREYINVKENGYIEGDENMRTNVKGVYVAGDVREKMFRQITTAVSDGTIAALHAEKYISEIKER
ncbi:thioredoxin-disulfide reductase [Clostridium perfringens]|uniref:thioredoxin-disulfide reductase n=1 Tax=Clostridium perfringens TaxID=1502 RepID=UPI0028CF00D5|nr:thioredoxin-disulfide reductase [Clostridium perfringens]MDT7932561.1 thioredoxin-disulfide reductase [Clostridium perfringens]MDT7956855.1 thioredoxin-disulfide reductase [Clostridium perfringens]